MHIGISVSLRNLNSVFLSLKEACITEKDPEMGILLVWVHSHSYVPIFTAFAGHNFFPRLWDKCYAPNAEGRGGIRQDLLFLVLEIPISRDA